MKMKKPTRERKKTGTTTTCADCKKILPSRNKYRHFCLRKACQVCAVTFSRLDSLVKHVKKFHQNDATCSPSEVVLSDEELDAEINDPTKNSANSNHHHNQDGHNGFLCSFCGTIFEETPDHCEGSCPKCTSNVHEYMDLAVEHPEQVTNNWTKDQDHQETQTEFNMVEIGVQRQIQETGTQTLAVEQPEQVTNNWSNNQDHQETQTEFNIHQIKETGTQTTVTFMSPVCSICPLVSTVVELQPCGHQFHKECINKWFKDKKKCSCPNCRGTVQSYKDEDGEIEPVEREPAVPNPRTPLVFIAQSSFVPSSTAPRLGNPFSPMNFRQLTRPENAQLLRRKEIYRRNARVVNSTTEWGGGPTRNEAVYANTHHINRMTPWLKREILALMPPETSLTRLAYVFEQTLWNAERLGAGSHQFRWILAPLLNRDQETCTHFQHEFVMFRASDLDMHEYDRRCEYPDANREVPVIDVETDQQLSFADRLLLNPLPIPMPRRM